MSRRPIVLAAGGTGGHMFPAEALARELLARGREVALVTDRRGQAFGDKLPGVAVHRIRAGRLGGNLVRKAMGAAELVMGAFDAWRVLRQTAPAVAVGFGGYPSVPTMLAAGRLGIPTVLHEQNAVLGRANRLLAGRARVIATAFPEVAHAPRQDGRVADVGNPVRPAIALLRDALYPALGHDTPLEILVLGGSQGARIFSDVVPAALARLSEPLKRRLKVSQQARPEDLERAKAAYAETGVPAELKSFFDDVPERLARAHLVITRSGASTTSELTVAGRPAILVPYAHAADDHQTANARALVAGGAAWLVPQGEFTAARLAQKLEDLVVFPERLQIAAAAARALGRPDAARRLADLVLEVAGDNGMPARLTENAA